jgi:hypothetical protein
MPLKNLDTWLLDKDDDYETTAAAELHVETVRCVSLEEVRKRLVQVNDRVQGPRSRFRRMVSSQHFRSRGTMRANVIRLLSSCDTVTL